MSSPDRRFARYALVAMLGMALLLPVGVLAEPAGSHNEAGPGFTYHKLTAAEAAEFTSSGTETTASGENGLALPTAADWSSYVGKLNVVDSVTPSAAPSSSNMQIYNSPYFPKIGNQGTQGSCAAWAATYYSYGYMEAVDQGWTGASQGDATQLLSPAWTYNRVIAEKGGSWMWDNFFIIRDWGVPTMSTMPYNAGNDINWGSEAAWREAPMHRGLEVFTLNYNSATTISDIKALIDQGIPVTFCINSRSFTTAFSDGNYIISSSEYRQTDLDHAQTIVGYDDSVSDDGDVGAFRVANSWGSTWGDSGFYWLTYSAVKEIGGLPVDPTDDVHDYLCLSYITDRNDYRPTTLISWQFDKVNNHCGGSDANITVTVKQGDTVVMTKQPFTLLTTRSATHYFPSFMLLDVSEARDAVINGAEVQLALSSPQMGGRVSTLTSYKVEYHSWYETSNSAPLLISRQADGLPLRQPFAIGNVLDPEGAPGYPNALDVPGQFFASSGTCSWVGVSSVFMTGDSSVQSGIIGDDSTTTLQTWAYGPGTVSFWWKASSEAGYDFLSFYVGNVTSEGLKARISGNTDWQFVSYDLGPGRQQISWQYAKDFSTAEGEDAGWVDNVTLMQMDDIYEPNNDLDHPAEVGAGTTADLICANDDWYKSYVHAGEDVTVKISFTRALGELKLAILFPDGAWITSVASGDSETLTYTMVPVAGYMFMEVYGNDGAMNAYSLEIYASADFLPGNSSSLFLDEGTGNYTGASSGTIQVIAGAQLRGMVSLSRTSAWAPEQMPFVIVPNWWAPEDYYWASVDVPTGTSSFYMDLGTITVPTTPGDYYITIAFHPEFGGPSYLASATYSRLPSPVWNDENDLYSLTAEQLASADASGRIAADYLVAPGEYIQASIPCAVIHIRVVDDIAPVTVASGYGTQGSGGWYTSSLSVVLNATDQGTGVAATYFSLDSAPAALYNAPVGIFADGTHTIAYWSVDLQGNVESRHTLTIRVDTSLPTASIAVQATGAQGRGGYDLGQPLITLSGADAVSGLGAILYRYDGGEWQTYSGPFRYALLTSATIDVKAVDLAGNEGATVSRLLKVDASAPTVSLVFSGDHGNGQWYDSAVLVSLNVSEAGSGVDSAWYSFDGISFSNYTTPFWINSTGEYQIWARASDLAGNIGAVTSSSLSVDRDLPVPSVTVQGTQGDGIWWIGQLSVQLSAQDVGSGVASVLYSLDGANWAIYGNPFPIVGEGVHTLSLRASDLAGNQALQVDRQIGIDTAAPSMNFTFAISPAASGWFLSDPVPVVEIDDPVSGPGQVFLELDGTPITWDVGSALVAEGVHTLRCRVSDGAGNYGPWQEAQIQVDTIAPVTGITLSGRAGMGGWYTGQVLAALAAAENGSGLSFLEYRWDGGAWAVTNGSITCVSEGKHQLEFRAVDAAGNEESARQAQVWIDTVAPAVQLSTPSRDHFTTSAAEVRWSGVDAASGITSILVSVDGGAFVEQSGNATSARLSGLADGTHQVVVRFYDNAGNSMDLQSTVTVDTNPLSPGGPYGVLPLLIILGVVALAAGAFIFIRRRS